MSHANRLANDFTDLVLLRFVVMSPQAVNNLIQHDRYFQYLITPLSKLFKKTGVYLYWNRDLSSHELDAFESRRTDCRYETILTELQLRILTCIYFLQQDLIVKAEPHIDRALKLIQSHKAKFYTRSHGEFRMAHLAFLRVRLEYSLEIPVELAPWKQVKDIVGSGLEKCLEFLPQELTQSIKQCMEILIAVQRRHKFEELVLRRSRPLSIEDIRKRLYEELYHTGLWKGVGSAFPGSSVNNISELSKMEAEIEFLWPIFNEVIVSANAEEEISKLDDLLKRMIAYIVRSQSGSFPDRMQSFLKECKYLYRILYIYYTKGPYIFRIITDAHIFDIAIMVYKMREFTQYRKSLNIPSHIFMLWGAICWWYRLEPLFFGSWYHAAIVSSIWVDFRAGDWAAEIDSSAQISPARTLPNIPLNTFEVDEGFLIKMLSNQIYQAKFPRLYSGCEHVS